ncbi:hypothetical protein COB55_00680 [Candidatus Wolfebacteria bacterium]|nr:MAG: hypothetical protein COB55_00680 [Candidatus Wolfebacteria bacterium]
MSDSLTENVARLYRAGSEHSQQTKKLRKAVDQLLSWIKDNVPLGFQLPIGQIFPSGEFVFTCPTSTHEIKITIGEEHLLLDLQSFSGIIAYGFLDELSDSLEESAGSLESTSNTIESFLSTR